MRGTTFAGAALVAALIGATTGLAQPAPEGVAPPPTEAPPPPPPPPPPAAECVPACRSGFVCLSGACVSACNPPCAQGQICTASGECAVDEAAFQRYAQALAYQQSLAYRRADQPPRDPRMEERLAYRRVSRLTLGLMMTVQNMDARVSFEPSANRSGGVVYFDPTIYGGAVAVGYRVNFARLAGFALRLAAGVGRTEESSVYEVESTTALDLCLDAQFVIGPFGRFYLGPILWADYLSLVGGDADLYDYDEVRSGVGGGLGLLLLEREQLDLFVRVAGDLFNDFNPRFEFGLAWHFMLGEPDPAVRR